MPVCRLRVEKIVSHIFLLLTGCFIIEIFFHSFGFMDLQSPVYLCTGNCVIPFSVSFRKHCCKYQKESCFYKFVFVYVFHYFAEKAT